MGENSKIEWTHHTFNCWRGCTRVSKGCSACYAEKLSHRNPATLGVWGLGGTRVVAAESYWRQPLKWDRDAAKAGERRRVFCASLADVFEDWKGYAVNSDGLCMWDLPQGWTPTDMKLGVRMLTLDGIRVRLWQTILSTPWLDWLLLTKRPENILPTLRRVYDLQKSRALDDGCLAAWIDGSHPPDNVWIGTSTEDQAAADERIPHLLKVPAAVRFLSCEPLLGEIKIRGHVLGFDAGNPADCECGHGHGFTRCPNTGGVSRTCHVPGCECPGFRRIRGDGIHWTIVGGESGPGARPMHPEWARSLRDQCQASGVAYHFKQWGEWAFHCRPTDADELVQACLRYPNGRWVGPNGESTHVNWDVVHMVRVGKSAAGRLLDGVEWNEFPEAAHA